MCRTQSMAWGAILHFTITSACTNRWTIKRQQASTGTAKPWRQRPPSIDRRVVLTLGSTLEGILNFPSPLCKLPTGGSLLRPSGIVDCVEGRRHGADRVERQAITWET